MTDRDDGSPAGAPEWVVTYGDMMSLLLTFFIMLVSLSEVVHDQKFRAILESIQRYTGYRSGPLAPAGRSYPLNSLVTQLETLGSFTNLDTGRGGVRTQAPEGQDFHVFRTQEGTPQTIGEPIAFAPAGVDLSAQARRELEGIAAELAGKPNKIEIRAHAAPGPPSFDAAASDKTLLTYRRGRAIFALLEQQGIARERMRITAAGDTQPLPPSGDSRSPHHDRAEILMLDKFADYFRGSKRIEASSFSRDPEGSAAPEAPGERSPAGRG